jgi:predicted AlkP superfamily phosphohydrolase/phosphomutase
VDWARTRAFAYGLTGIFLNLRGRERHGIVKPGKDRLALQLEIKQKLEAYEDTARRQHPVRRCMLAQMALEGPYVKEAPDLLIGYRVGYRASWNSAVGKVTDRIIEPNTKSWSGDHAIDPRLVPGIFFSNWLVEERRPALADLGPTILALFGLEKQPFHDGRILHMTSNKAVQ